MKLCARQRMLALQEPVTVRWIGIASRGHTTMAPACVHATTHNVTILLRHDRPHHGNTMSRVAADIAVGQTCALERFSDHSGLLCGVSTGLEQSQRVKS